MKNLILSFSFFLVFSLIAASLSHAQATANVTAEVVGTVSVDKIEDVNFGSIVQNSNPVINPNAPGSSSQVGSSFTIGEFVVDSGGENDVILNFSTSVAMSGPGNNLTFTTNLVGDADDANQSTATQRTNGEQVTTAPNGAFYLWLGGDLGAIPANQDFGEYSGTFTITVTFP